MPIPIKFGTKEINDPDFTPKTTKEIKDGGNYRAAQTNHSW